MLVDAATQTTIAGYKASLRQRAEQVVVERFHEALRDGCADEILDSLRGQWDTHAEQIAAARDLIPPEQAAEQFLRTAAPAALAAWQSLDDHLAVITTIGAIAAQFGCRTGNFPMITEYAPGDGFRLDDRAIMATDGSLVMDSAMFQRPDQGHRTSPWFRAPLKLHTIGSAQARYNEWAADQFDAQHAGPRGGWVDETGVVHRTPAPPNPFRPQAVST